MFEAASDLPSLTRVPILPPFRSGESLCLRFLGVGKRILFNTKLLLPGLALFVLHVPKLFVEQFGGCIHEHQISLLASAADHSSIGC